MGEDRGGHAHGVIQFPPTRGGKDGGKVSLVGSNLGAFKSGLFNRDEGGKGDKPRNEIGSYY